MPEPTDAPDFSEEYVEEAELRVFVPKKLKDELVVANEYEDAIVRAAGSRTGVSLNKTYVRYLHWALEAGWFKQGGRPKNAKDREEKILRAAEVIKAARAATKKSEK